MPGDFIPAGPYVPPDGGGGTTDHRDLSHRNDAGQHTGAAISVTATYPGDDAPSTKTLTAAIAALLPQFGRGIRSARILGFTDTIDGTATEFTPAFRSVGAPASGYIPEGWAPLVDPVSVSILGPVSGDLPAIFIPDGPLTGLYSLGDEGAPWVDEGLLAGEPLFVLAGSATGGAAWFVPTNSDFFEVAPVAGALATRYEEVFLDVGQVVTRDWIDGSIHDAPGVATQAEVNGWLELVFGGVTISGVIRLDSFDPEAVLTLPGTIGGTPVYPNNRYLVAALDDTDPSWQGFYEFGVDGQPPVRLTFGVEGSGVGNWDNMKIAKVLGYGLGAGRQVPRTWYRGDDKVWRKVGELLEAAPITVDADLNPRFDVQPIDATAGSITVDAAPLLEAAALGVEQVLVRIDSDLVNTVTVTGTFNGSVVDPTITAGNSLTIFGGSSGLQLH